MAGENQDALYETWVIDGETLALEDVKSSRTYADPVRSDIPQDERYEVRRAGLRLNQFPDYRSAVDWIKNNFDIEDESVDQILSAASD